jgi:alpha-1,2-mannosyltransferase
MSDSADHPLAPASRPRPLLAGVYGVRLLYNPGSRRRLALVMAAAAVVVYVTRGALQLAYLGGTSLQFDYLHYFDAGAALNHGTDPYASFLGSCGQAWCNVGYIYPPLLAETFRPLALLPPYTGAAIWLLVSHLLVAATILVVHRTVRSWLSPTSEAFLLAAALLFLPLYQSLWFLQVGALLAFILALSGWAFVARRDGLAGAALGLAAVLRVTPLVMVPVLVRSSRQLTRPVGLAGLAVATALLLAGLQLLTPATSEFITRVLPRLGISTPILDNQSLSGLLLRVEVLFGIGHTPIAVATLLLQSAVLALTWRLSLGIESARGRAAVFAAFLAAVPIMSSITWDHHMVNELIVLALLAPSLAAGGRPLRLALLSYPLLWVNRGATDPLAGLLGLSQPHGLAVVPFLLVTALNLVGMLLLWVACLDVLAHGHWREPRPATAGTT